MAWVLASLPFWVLGALCGMSGIWIFLHMREDVARADAANVVAGFFLAVGVLLLSGLFLIVAAKIAT